MVVANLTDQLIKGGGSLIEALDSSGNEIDAAFWFLFPDGGYWKLMILFRNIEKDGPKNAYMKVQRALNKLKSDDRISLDDVAVAKPNAPVVALLRTVIKTGGRGNAGVRFSNNVINGQLIPDSYIYRLY
jgi:hypothetical protein